MNQLPLAIMMSARSKFGDGVGNGHGMAQGLTDVLTYGFVNSPGRLGTSGSPPYLLQRSTVPQTRDGSAAGQSCLPCATCRRKQMQQGWPPYLPPGTQGSPARREYASLDVPAGEAGTERNGGPRAEKTSVRHGFTSQPRQNYRLPLRGCGQDS